MSGVKQSSAVDRWFYLFRVFGLFMGKEEPTSGLEPLTCSLRVSSQALQGCAVGCNPCISKRFSPLWLALCCTVLRSRWYQQRHSSCTIVLTRARIRSTPSTSRHTSIQLTLDHYSHWMPSMGRDTAEGMDEALGLAPYSCPWLPLRGSSGSHSHSKTWAGCGVSPTAPIKTLLNASSSVSSTIRLQAM